MNCKDNFHFLTKFLIDDYLRVDMRVTISNLRKPSVTIAHVMTNSSIMDNHQSKFIFHCFINLIYTILRNI